ncbi:hypothetical protein TVAG_297120 [Trichomonas vaginalis G3]|uniref:Uncharacterized protein n=1 Tax=Trichomonas vaginalis (strain ATCC PRA-98 / G3) TaxID=412133 RepID=A2DRA7_TRIV3|nr:hypothetical protein TVAGG3_0512680 [Trichomonas vaginalis G3]EAY17033.1 hypothetical protein TVAG_297120 [Trichomonas vaginalis G3]KAI5517896.1 hypothetical protein TVAGG3_0512680 [Trichomonas vaginalis G3]|eukprot:XP_001329256.1 hypothetical protein [Trichomonas vaginalis G3]
MIFALLKTIPSNVSHPGCPDIYELPPEPGVLNSEDELNPPLYPPPLPPFPSHLQTALIVPFLPSEPIPTSFPKDWLAPREIV